MGQLVPIETAAKPCLASLQVDRSIRYFANKLMPGSDRNGARFVIAAADAPTAYERQALEVRRADLGRWLVPSKPSWVHAQLTGLQALRPAPKGSEADQAAAMKLAANVLADVPPFALSFAFEAAHRGEIGRPAFMPTPAELRQAAMRHVEPYLREQRRLTAILGAKVRTVASPEARKAAADAARAMFRAQPQDHPEPML